MKIVVGVTGATGAPVALSVLEQLKDAGVETHLIVSQWAKTTIALECGQHSDDLSSLAHRVYDNRNLSAIIASGSFRHDGMIIVPCSMKTVASIRVGLSDNLISRAADVTLKERRRLVLGVRETPLNAIHLENMLFLSKIGCTIFPLSPSYYNKPQTIDAMNRYMAVRLLDQFGLDGTAGGTNGERWGRAAERD